MRVSNEAECISCSRCMDKCFPCIYLSETETICRDCLKKIIMWATRTMYNEYIKVSGSRTLQ